MPSIQRRAAKTPVGILAALVFYPLRVLLFGGYTYFFLYIPMSEFHLYISIPVLRISAYRGLLVSSVSRTGSIRLLILRFSFHNKGVSSK